MEENFRGSRLPHFYFSSLSLSASIFASLRLLKRDHHALKHSFHPQSNTISARTRWSRPYGILDSRSGIALALILRRMKFAERFFARPPCSGACLVPSVLSAEC